MEHNPEIWAGCILTLQGQTNYWRWMFLSRCCFLLWSSLGVETVWDWLFKWNLISRSFPALLRACDSNYLQNKGCVDCVLPNDLAICDGFPPDCQFTLCRKDQHCITEVNTSWSPKNCLIGSHCWNVLLSVDYHKLYIWIFKLVQSIRPQASSISLE